MWYFIVGFVCLALGAVASAVVCQLGAANEKSDELADLYYERDYWHREAVKNAAALGEIKIHEEQSKQAEA